MAGLFESIIDNLKEKKQEGKLKTGYRFSDDGKLSVGGGYYDDDKMFEVEIGKDNANILFKKSFKDGGSTNGSGDKAFTGKVKELMDDGYEFGEAVKEAMRQGYVDGGVVQRLGLSSTIKRLFDAGKGAPTITKELKIIFPAQADKISQTTIGNYLSYAKKNLGWTEPTIKNTNQFGSKITKAVEIKRKANVEKLIKNNPEKYFNQKETAKLIGKDRAALVKSKDYPKPGKQTDDLKTKARNKAKTDWTKKYSSVTIQDKLKGNQKTKNLAHMGNKYEKVTTGNTQYLNPKKNRKLYFKFEKEYNRINDDIQKTKIKRITKDYTINDKTKELAKHQNDYRKLKNKNPNFAKLKTRQVIKKSPLSKLGFMSKSKLLDPSLSFSGGKTGANVVFKNASKADLAKIKDLATKGNSLYSFPAQLADSPGMSKAAIKAAAKSVGKVLGVAALPLEAYFMKQMYDEGKTMAEILSSPLMLNSVVGDAQDLLKMNSLERQAVTNERIANDESLLDTDFSQPYREGLQSVNTEMVKERVAQERAAEEAKRAANRNKPKQSFTLEPFLGIKSFDSEV